MKPGDKVWVFDNIRQIIVEAELVKIHEKGLAQLKYNGSSQWYAHHPFPTREALCEHYRKIFENNTLCHDKINAE